MSSLWALSLAVASATPTAPAPLRLELVASPHFSMEVGARDLATMERVAFLYDGVLSEKLAFDESTAARRMLGRAGRLAKLALVDVPLSAFSTVAQHEAFGHAARAREVGHWPSTSFSLPPPYLWLFSPGQGALGQTTGVAFDDSLRDITFDSGGVESGVIASQLTGLRTLRDGRAHYSQALRYLTNRTPYFDWFALGPGGRIPEGDGDMDQYVIRLAMRFNRLGREDDLRTRLRIGWALQFIDPMWWAFTVQLVADYLWSGQRWSATPHLRLGRFAAMPMVTWVPGPFGGEHEVHVTLGDEHVLLDARVRAATTGLARSLAAGVRVFEWRLSPDLDVGGALDVWLQPDLALEFRNALDGSARFGVSAMVEAGWHPKTRWGVVAQFGWKSSGWVPGQPLATGPYGLLGVSLDLDE